MAEMATYIGVTPRTVTPGASLALGRGLRVVIGSDGLATLAGSTVRGEHITLVSGDVGEPVSSQAIEAGGKVPAVASENASRGDVAYSAANGQTSKTATSAVRVGKWASDVTAGNLGEVELTSVA